MSSEFIVPYYNSSIKIACNCLQLSFGNPSVYSYIKWRREVVYSNLVYLTFRKSRNLSYLDSLISLLLLIVIKLIKKLLAKHRKE